MEESFTGRLCDYSGLDYELIERHGGIQWPYPANTVEVTTTRLYSDGQFSDRRWKGSADLRRVGTFS